MTNGSFSYDDHPHGLSNHRCVNHKTHSVIDESMVRLILLEMSNCKTHFVMNVSNGRLAQI